MSKPQYKYIIQSTFKKSKKTGPQRVPCQSITLGPSKQINVDSRQENLKYKIPVVPHKAVAEVSKIGNL